MTISDIENLFDLYRFRNQQDFAKVLLYFPFGFVLLIFRLAVGVLLWPFLTFFPVTSKHRRVALRGACLAFGIFTRKDIINLNKNVKILVCNHISILDHIAVEAALACKQINICSHFSEWSFPSLFQYINRHSANEVLINRMNFLQCINASEEAVATFPEGATTNGRFGLLKFNTLPFDTPSAVQPVVLQIAHMSSINISPSVVGASSWSDLLWMLFVPYTVFSLRILPPVKKMDNESSNDFGKRVQEIMASSLNVLPTDYTSRNKSEYEKNLATGTVHQTTPSLTIPHQMDAFQLNRMGSQVKEILPDVPLPVILQDLGLTKSVDETVFRILEGVVFYIPENPASSSSSASSSTNSYNLPSSSQWGDDLPPLYTAIGTFGKTPNDRMLSYQERKAALVKAARLRYLKQHALIQ